MTTAGGFPWYCFVIVQFYSAPALSLVLPFSHRPDNMTVIFVCVTSALTRYA